jgi:hypothetical protein
MIMMPFSLEATQKMLANQMVDVRQLVRAADIER